jgi:hypothetical protein
MANTSDCYVLGDVVDWSRDKGQMSGVATFGLDIAEKVIFEHYVQVTNGSEFTAAVLEEADWPDHGGKRNYVDMLVRRNKNVNADKLMARRMQWPDIVTHNGIKTSSVAMLVDSFRPLTYRPAVKSSLPRGRYEYYEIKPDSPSGKSRGVEKLKNIDSVYSDFQLPYKPGKYYPPPGQDDLRIPLPVNRMFVVVCGTILARHGIRKIELTLKVRRHQDGLLLYMICVSIDTDDKKKKSKSFAKEFTRHIMAVYLYCLAPERYKDLLLELGDTSYEGDALPRIHCTFDVIPELKPFTSLIETGMYERGLVFPGEEWLLCCDESVYRHLVPFPGPNVETLWAGFSKQAEAWAEYLGGKKGVDVLRQQVLVKVEELARLANLAVPGLKEFANAVIRWIHDHPYATVALIVVPIVVTGGLAAVIDAGVLAGGALFAAEMSGGELVGAQMVGGVGRTALSTAVVEATSGPGVAAATAARGVLTFEGVAAQYGGAGIAANDTLPFVTAALQAAKPIVTKTAIAAGMLAVMTFSTQAYAATSGAPTNQNAESSASSTTRRPQIIAETSAGIYIVRALAAHRGARDAIKGEPINIHDYGLIRDYSDFSKEPEIPPRQMVRYLGRVAVR